MQDTKRFFVEKTNKYNNNKNHGGLGFCGIELD
jgi:hypothetical protein